MTETVQPNDHLYDPDDRARRSAINPFGSLSQLANVINAIDKFLSDPGQVKPDPLLYRRLAYLRNTLIVAYDLWQNDIHSRVGRSMEKFYVFCMTDHERVGFLRRMTPALMFAAEEMQILAITNLGHLAGLIQDCAEQSADYANNNKACVKLGIKNQDNQPWRNYDPLRLPKIEVTI